MFSRKIDLENMNFRFFHTYLVVLISRFRRDRKRPILPAFAILSKQSQLKPPSMQLVT